MKAFAVGLQGMNGSGHGGGWLAKQGLAAADFDENGAGHFVKYRQDAGYRQKQHRDVFTLLPACVHQCGVWCARSLRRGRRNAGGHVSEEFEHMP